MTGRILMRQVGDLTCLTKLLRQTNVRMIKFNQYSESSDDGDNKLSGLLSNLSKKSNNKEPKLARPKGSTRRAKGLRAPAIDTEGIEPELVDATQHVASMSKTPQTTQSDLLKKLKNISDEAKEAKNENLVQGEKTGGIADLFSDLKIEKKPRSQLKKISQERKMNEDKTKNLTMEQRAFLEKRAQLRRQKSGVSLEESYKPIDLFGAPPLGIFTQPPTTSAEPSSDQIPNLRIWRRCMERELTIMSQPEPRNALEEFVEWTEDGKLWHFPVDNEQGLDYSQEKFHQHVFLEKHIKDWCPPAGPVKHFMDLVCVGLSKNPYMSLDYKINTIQWFRTYFEKEEINEILIHKGAWMDPADNNIANQKST